VWCRVDEDLHAQLRHVVTGDGCEPLGAEGQAQTPDRSSTCSATQWTRCCGDQSVTSPPSNARRSSTVPAFLADALAEQMQGKHPNDLLFAGDDGSYLRPTGTRQTSKGWFVYALRRAGLPKMTIHDLRHSAASLTISAGANAKNVQAMLGHVSATMTLDTNADLFPDDLDAVTVALDHAASQQVALKVRS